MLVSSATRAKCLVLLQVLSDDDHRSDLLLPTLASSHTNTNANVNANKRDDSDEVKTIANTIEAKRIEETTDHTNDLPNHGAWLW